MLLELSVLYELHLKGMAMHSEAEELKHSDRLSTERDPELQYHTVIHNLTWAAADWQEGDDDDETTGMSDCTAATVVAGVKISCTDRKPKITP